MIENETFKDDLTPLEYVGFMITVGIIFGLLKIVDFFRYLKGLV